MPKFRSENKNLWRSNKHQTINQPVTEAINQRQHIKNTIKIDYSEIKKPLQFRSSMCIENGPKQARQADLLLINKFHNNKKQTFKFEIKCIDQNCEMDDIKSVLSFGGYSVKSKFNKSNEIVHNHRKVNKEAAYDFVEGQIPYLEVESNDQAEISELLSKNEEKPKKDWKKSSFAPLFFTKIDNPHQLERQAIQHEKRQKEIIQIHDRNFQIQIEARKSKYEKNFSTYIGKKPLKQIKSIEPSEKEQSKSQQSESNSVLKNGKMRTRQQQKILNHDGFEISKIAQPVNKQCYPCKMKFDNYKEHIESKEHKINVKKALGSSYFVEDIAYLEGMKKRQIESEEYKMLQDFADYLEKIADSNEQYIMKKHEQLQMNLQQVKREIKRWLHL